MLNSAYNDDFCVPMFYFFEREKKLGHFILALLQTLTGLKPKTYYFANIYESPLILFEVPKMYKI
jgi:hypothetical protein